MGLSHRPERGALPVCSHGHMFVKSTEGRHLNHDGRGPLSLYVPAPPPSALFSLGDTRLQAFGVEPRWVASGMRLSSVESMCEVCSLQCQALAFRPRVGRCMNRWSYQNRNVPQHPAPDLCVCWGRNLV